MLGEGDDFVDVSVVFLPEHLFLLALPEEVAVIRELCSTPGAVGLKKRGIVEVRRESEDTGLEGIGGDVSLELLQLEPLVDELLPL